MKIRFDFLRFCLAVAFNDIPPVCAFSEQLVCPDKKCFEMICCYPLFFIEDNPNSIISTVPNNNRSSRAIAIIEGQYIDHVYSA